MTALVRATSGCRVLPVLVLVAAVLALGRGTPWLGDPSRPFAWISGTSTAVAPFVAGCAAVDLARWSRPGTLGALRATAGAPRSRLHLLGGNALAGVLVVALGQLIGVVADLAQGAGLPRGEVALPVLVASWAVMLAAAAVGAGTGLVLPALVAGPAAAIVVYGLVVLPAFVPAPEVLRLDAPTGGLAGIRANPELMGANAVAGVLLLLVVAGCLVVLDAVVRRRGQLVGTGVLGVLLVAALAAGSVLSRHAAQNEASSGTVPTSCSGRAPEVCVPDGSEVDAATLADEFGRQVGALERLDVTVPATFELPAAGRTVRADRGVVLVDVSAEWLPDLVGDVAFSLATPRDCPQFRAARPPGVDYFVAKEALAAWIVVESGRAPLEAFAGLPVHDWWEATEAGVRETWVVTTYAALAECRVDEVRLG